MLRKKKIKNNEGGFRLERASSVKLGKSQSSLLFSESVSADVQKLSEPAGMSAKGNNNYKCSFFSNNGRKKNKVFRFRKNENEINEKLDVMCRHKKKKKKAKRLSNSRLLILCDRSCKQK